MSQIYKINVINNNEISKIFVFSGNRELTSSDQGKIFKMNELRYIQQNNVPVKYVNSTIYDDDTIRRVKEKIFKFCDNINNPTIDEMYLFSLTKKKFNFINTFNNLTQQNSIDLNETILNQFLYNIVQKSNTIQNKRISSFFQDNVKKNIYNENDFNQLNIKWDDRIEYITSPIGQKLVIKNNYPLVANPFNNNIIDPIIDREINNIVSTQNSYLLFKYFPIINNNIYLCTAENVINYAETNQLNAKYFLKLYFPTLFRTVKTKDSLISTKLQRYNKQKENINKYFKKINDKIDLFYNIFNSGDILKRNKEGIKYCNINVHPINSIKLPLERSEERL